MSEIKFVPFYFPQYHCIPENDEWWGEGYTDWHRVKNSTALLPGHYQPRVPLNNNYYDLSQAESVRWQVELAQKYKIDGFCFYHYWFNGKLLLEKPLNSFYNLKHDLNYCIAWANETWTRRWIGKVNDILIKQNHYDDVTEWEAHFNYLLKFFLDPRSIKLADKPVFLIYRPDLIKSIKRFIDYFQTLAIKNGLPGICFIGIKSYESTQDFIYSNFDAVLKFQPRELFNTKFKKGNIFSYWMERNLRALPERFQIIIGELKHKYESYKVFDYDIFWKELIKNSEMDFHSKQTIFQSIIADWDNSPRYGRKARFFHGVTPEKFKNYLIELSKIEAKKKDSIVFINAWNEWSEGAYLEPDNVYGCRYLEILKDIKTNMF